MIDRDLRFVLLTLERPVLQAYAILFLVIDELAESLDSLMIECSSGIIPYIAVDVSPRGEREMLTVTILIHCGLGILTE